MDSSELDLVMAGTHEGVLMVESEAKELSEEVMLGAVLCACQPAMAAITLAGSSTPPGGSWHEMTVFPSALWIAGGSTSPGSVGGITWC
mgnify:CR=1 FL=1